MADGLNNVDAKLLKLAEEYHALNVRSRGINEERGNIRENVDKLGISPKAFQVALIMARDLNKGERADYADSLNRVLGVLDGKEADLFGAEDIRKRDERAQKRADKAAGKTTPKAKADAKSDKNKRSDPKSGGAGKNKAAKDAPGAADAPPAGDQPPPDAPPPTEEPPAPPSTLAGTVAAGDALIKKTAAELQSEQEQREGAELLNRSGNGTAPAGDNPGDKSVENGGEANPPLSQSAQAAAVRDKLGLH